MKKLTDYKEEIHKCSKCGLCQSVCPVYEQTGNDCSVSRGKFIMLNGIIKGDLELNNNVNKYLDMCLKCNACKDFCPSGIDAREIFLSAKAEYFKKCPSSFFIRSFQSKFVFNSVLNLVKLASNTYRFFNIDKIVLKLYPLFLKMGWVGKKIILANEFISHNPVGQVCPTYRYNDESRSGIPARQHAKMNVIYFKGCVNEFVNPSVKNATENVLQKLGAEVLDINFECCGIPFLSSGNAEQFKNQAKFNLSRIPDEFDYFLTDCASCAGAFSEYKNFVDDEVLIKKLDKILEKSQNVSDFILNNIESIKFDKKTKVTFHKPCHLENADFVEEILKKAENVEYVQMEEFDKCCGFSGEFAIKNPELSEKISAKKAKNALSTNADYILTTCPACKLGLVQGLIEQKKFVPVLNLVEFIAMAELVINRTSDKSFQRIDNAVLVSPT